MLLRVFIYHRKNFFSIWNRYFFLFEIEKKSIWNGIIFSNFDEIYAFLYSFYNSLYLKWSKVIIFLKYSCFFRICLNDKQNFIEIRKNNSISNRKFFFYFKWKQDQRNLWSLARSKNLKRSQISDHRSQITDHRSQISGGSQNLRISDLKFKSSIRPRLQTL